MCIIRDVNIAGKNVHKYRTAKGLSLDELGRLSGWDGKNLHRLEQTGSGYTHKSISRLAEALNVNLKAIFDESDALTWGRMVPLDIYTPEMIHRDVRGEISIDQPAHETGGISGVLFTDGSFAEDAFGFAVNDEAMRPTLVPGDMVIVDPSLRPDPNDLVLAIIHRHKNDSYQVVIRKYADRAEGFELLPQDNAYAVEYPINDNIGIVGTVVEQRRQRKR